MSAITYEAIERSLLSVDLRTLKAAPAAADAVARVQRLLTIYRAVRPLLLALTMLPLPPRFGDALQLFTVTLDQLAASVPAAHGGFKAGKDL
jgi:hypothetical protein